MSLINEDDKYFFMENLDTFLRTQMHKAFFSNEDLTGKAAKQKISYEIQQLVVGWYQDKVK